MNKWTAAFAATSALFVGATAHLWQRLREERAVAAMAPMPMSTSPRAMSPDPSRDADLQAMPQAPAAAVPQASSPAHDVSDQRFGAGMPSHAEVTALKRAQLERLEDPVRRAEMRARAVSMFREDLFSVAKRLELSGEQHDALAVLMVEQGWRRQAARLRCELDPACTADPTTLFDEQGARIELAQLLGADKADRYLALTSNTSERADVAHFNDRLPKGAELSDEQVEKLVAALAEQTRAFKESARRANAGMVEVPWLGAAAVDANAPDRQARVLEAATAYSRAARERAATILSPAQLTAFDEMQDERLARLRSARTP